MSCFIILNRKFILLFYFSTREIELDKTGIGRRVKVRSKVVNGGGIAARRSLPAVTTPPAPHTKPQGNNQAQKPGNPDLMKRPIR